MEIQEGLGEHRFAFLVTMTNISETVDPTESPALENLHKKQISGDELLFIDWKMVVTKRSKF